MMRLTNKLSRYIQQNHLFPPDETVVLAVSGGADSLTLLHILHGLRERLKITLHVATFDHGLRPQAIDDVLFVQRVANALGLPTHTGHGDLSKQTNGSEAVAREARYQFLAQVARKVGARRIVTAHHAGDQAETVLMHLLRGAGLQGLRGMQHTAPLPTAPDLLLVRPLLFARRADLLAYCRQHGLGYRDDPTNQDTTFTRNYVRHKVLPMLKNLNPDVESALLRLAENAAVDQTFIEQAYQQGFRPQVDFRANRVLIPREGFARWHTAMQRRALFDSLVHLSSDVEVGQVHIVQALDVAQRGEIGAVAQFPGGYLLRVDYDHLVIEHRSATMQGRFLLPDAGFARYIPVPGTVRIPGAGWGIQTRHDPTDEPGWVALPAGTLILRGRSPGDRIQPRGMAGKSKKIKDWMIDRKIPRNVRDRLPLLFIDGHLMMILTENQAMLTWSADINNTSSIVFVKIYE